MGKTIPKLPHELDALLQEHLHKIDIGSDHVVTGSAAALKNYELYTDNIDGSISASLKLSPISIVETTGSQLFKKVAEYERLYSIIKDCNVVIGTLTETERSRNTIGAAYSLRAVCYFNLLRKFCEVPKSNPSDQLGLPIVTTFSMEDRPTRADLQKTMNFIEDEFKKALRFNITDGAYLFTADVTQAYLAKFYHWTHRWSEARQEAQAVLTKYPLVENEHYRDMMTAQYALKGNNLIKSPMYSDVGIVYDLYYKEIIQFPISKEFIDIFTEKERDIRYQLFVKKRSTTKTISFTIRSAEMALIVMESYIHDNQEALALKELNEFRDKRITNNIAYTMTTLPMVDLKATIKQDAMGLPITPLTQAVLNERRKELFFECDRWFELKRNGTPELWVASGGGKIVTKPYMYTFPIPITDVMLIKGMKQNDGYILK